MEGLIVACVAAGIHLYIKNGNKIMEPGNVGLKLRNSSYLLRKRILESRKTCLESGRVSCQYTGYNVVDEQLCRIDKELEKISNKIRCLKRL